MDHADHLFDIIPQHYAGGFKVLAPIRFLGKEFKPAKLGRKSSDSPS
jgi:hypothetical protein